MRVDAVFTRDSIRQALGGQFATKLTLNLALRVGDLEGALYMQIFVPSSHVAVKAMVAKGVVVAAAEP